ncbi:MAG: VOC family protein [Terracidiphilus sp.]|jgi:PhnB protein
MKVNTYLNFPGTCQEAMNFYVKHLGAKILMKSTFADMSAQDAPQNLPPGLNRDGILHARFTLGDTIVMASDGPPERCQPMRSAYLTLSVESNEEAERIYAALNEGGEVFMKMGETFFAHRFGQFRDKFGVNWMVIHEKPMPRPA